MVNITAKRNKTLNSFSLHVNYYLSFMKWFPFVFLYCFVPPLAKLMERNNKKIQKTACHIPMMNNQGVWMKQFSRETSHHVLQWKTRDQSKEVCSSWQWIWVCLISLNGKTCSFSQMELLFLVLKLSKPITSDCTKMWLSRAQV